MSLKNDDKLDVTCCPNDERPSSELTVFAPSDKDLGDGFIVNRMLPRLREGRKMIGPFIFWDHMGPVTIKTPEQMAVRPHPHIGLATLTFLFEGEIMHKDSLGYEQPIRPGEVNWMVAGSGIVHSERTAPLPGIVGKRIHGIQSWIALPKEAEDTSPSFHHYSATDLPKISSNGGELTLVAGSALGETSPVKTFSDMFYLFGDMKVGESFLYELEAKREGALYAPNSRVRVRGQEIPSKHLVVFEKGERIEFQVLDDGPVTLFGGEPFPEDRHIWWNFVSTSKQKIDKAKEDWAHQRFDKVEGDEEFIPLPS